MPLFAQISHAFTTQMKTQICRGFLLLTLSLMSFCPQAQAQPNSTVQLQKIQSSETDMQRALMQLMKYRRVDPQRSLRVIEKYGANVDQLSPVHQVNWHLSELTVFHGLNLNASSAGSLQKLARIPPGNNGLHRHNEVLMYLGNYYIKTSQFQHAVSAYVCSVNLVDSATRAIPMIYAIAVSFRMSGETEKTRQIFRQLLDYLQIANIPRWSALVEEALGIMAMENGDYSLAKNYLTNAMDKQQQTAARAKELNVILNLLLTFALNGEFTHYERLQPRAIRLNHILRNQEKHIYLEWIQALANHLQGTPLSAGEQHYLLQRFTELENVIMRKAIETNIAKPLNITLPSSQDGANPASALPKLDNLLSRFDCLPHPNALAFVDHYLDKIELKHIPHPITGAPLKTH